MDTREITLTSERVRPRSGAAIPAARPRRLRLNPQLRRMVRETQLVPDDFIYPLFVTHGRNVKAEIKSMPGVFQWSPDLLAREVEAIAALGIPAVILFGIPAEKDPLGLENFAPDGIVQQAVRVIKDAVPELIAVTDVCLCEYTDHGHCGVMHGAHVDNDATLVNLGKQAVAAARAGADVIAPSAAMDGQVQAIRRALDDAGFTHIPIMAYSTKFASALYGPFREAGGSALKGDRKSYQMNPMNRREAVRESLLDEQEGADALMVKPAGAYLDIIRDIREASRLPVAAYQVSGEYAMIKFGAQAGAIDEDRVVRETLGSIKRAGADLIFTYFAMDLAVAGI